MSSPPRRRGSDSSPASAGLSLSRGLAGGAPDSVEAFQAGFGPHVDEILADIRDYTDLSPVIQTSEVVVA